MGDASSWIAAVHAVVIHVSLQLVALPTNITGAHAGDGATGTDPVIGLAAARRA